LLKNGRQYSTAAELKGEFVMENIMETSGVNESVAAEQMNNVDENITSTEELVETPTTGVEETPAAEEETKFDEKTESAFAKRLSAERQKIEQESSKKIAETESRLNELQQKWEATQQQQQKQTLTEAYQATVAQVAADYGADPAALLEIAETLIAKHPDVIEAQGLKAKEAEVLTQKQQQEKINADAMAFKANFPDVDINTIPAECWEKVDKGYSLTDSYQIYENKILKEKIAAQEKALQVKETNAKNAASSPGSVTGQGATTADYISQETFEQNKGDQNWIMKNLEKIQESRAKLKW